MTLLSAQNSNNLVCQDTNSTLGQHTTAFVVTPQNGQHICSTVDQHTKLWANTPLYGSTHHFTDQHTTLRINTPLYVCMGQHTTLCIKQNKHGTTGQHIMSHRTILPVNRLTVDHKGNVDTDPSLPDGITTLGRRDGRMCSCRPAVARETRTRSRCASETPSNRRSSPRRRN